MRLKDRPEVLGVERTSEQVLLSLQIPPDLDCLPHHFPALAIVPGVLQLAWALALAAEHLGVQGTFEQVTSLKFQRPMLPRARLQLTLVRLSPREFSFQYANAGGGYSGGRIRLQ